VHLKPRHQRKLAKLIEARERADQAEREAVKAAREAVKAGVPQQRVAEVLGVSRMTLWRRLQEDSPQRSARDGDTSGRTTHQEKSDEHAEA
jgi:DNA invertase Pin-like site-specific DNA recombinase